MKLTAYQRTLARVMGTLTCVTLSAPPAAAQFDWGGAAGRGTFEQTIKHKAIVDVGEIPDGLQEVAIHLSSVQDVDVQLIDKTTGTKIVAWPDGLLRGPDRQELSYRGMKIVYSGYDGDGRGQGREYILITTTTRTLLMKAFGYQEGLATVAYRWGHLGGSGTFQQQIQRQDIVDVGEIPPGLEQIEIFLKSDNDVDIQLYDKETGVKIVAWPDGLLHGASYQQTTYRGVTIAYSGFNGYHGDWGKEYILIRNRTNRTLLMKAYGYRSGFGQVTYQWGSGWVEHEAAFVAPIRFSQGEPDPAWLRLLLGVPEAVVSEVPFTLAELLVGKGAVGKFFLGPLKVMLDILDVIPAAGGSLEMENEVLLARNGEWIKREFGNYRIKAHEPATVVAVTYAAGDFSLFPPRASRFARNLELRRRTDNTWTQLPILQDEEVERLSQYVVVPKRQLDLPEGLYWLRWGGKTVGLVVEKN